MATSLYDTFGNDIKYRIDEGTIRTYLVNSTIDFPLPALPQDDEEDFFIEQEC